MAETQNISRPNDTRRAPTLGRLETVPLRQVWPHEANDFTPWLAEPDNLSLLADTLNLDELQVQGTEVPVGNFSIDILALDVEGVLDDIDKVDVPIILTDRIVEEGGNAPMNRPEHIFPLLQHAAIIDIRDNRHRAYGSR